MDQPLSSTSPDFMKQTAAVSSRMARTEQKKLMRQTLMFGLGSIALGLVFVFVILPGFIRLLNTYFSNSGTNFNSDDTIPPQIPIISAPVDATFSAQLKLSGYGEADSELVVVVNASENLRQKIGSDGTFEVELDLTKGENVVSTYAVDASGNESATSKNYTIILDNEAPTLEITEPQNSQTIEQRKNQVTTIKGTTEENARVYVNGRLVFAGSDGSFSTTYQLQDGENKLLIKAEDKAGNTTETELTVQFNL